MDGKYLWMEADSYSQVVRKDGKNLHWITDIQDELPIIMGPSPISSLPPLTFNQLFDSALSTHSKSLAFRYKVNESWVGWTYEDYYLDAKKFGAGLVSLGISAKSCINIIGFNSPQWVIGFAGSLLSGCVPVGVYATNNVEACEYIADHSEAQLILVQNELQLKKYLKFWHRLPNIKAIVVYWPGQELESIRKGHNIYTWEEFLKIHTGKDLTVLEERLQKIKPSQCATIVYTSGTTGPPKGVLLSHDNLSWTARSALEIHKVTVENERLVSFLPLSHVAAMELDIIGALYCKVAVTFADENALHGSLLITLKETRPTIFFAVPRVYEKFEEKIRAVGAATGIKKTIGDWAKKVGFESSLKQVSQQPTSYSYTIANQLIFKKIKQAIGLDQCKVFIAGAAPISKSCLDYFLSINIIISNIYGMSECSAPACTNTNTNYVLYSAGRPLPGEDLVIKSKHGEVLPTGRMGEICFRGRNKFMGYYKNEIATKETIDSQGFIHSGDEGFMNENGFVFITGRYKELIVTAGGENIPPVLIEDSVKEACKIISNCFLIGDGRKYLSMIISFKTLPNPDGTFSSALAPEVVSFTKSLGLNATVVEELIESPEIKKYVQDCINSVNKTATSRAQEIKKFAFIKNDFSIASGELTATMKVKRKVVLEKYKSLIEEIYNDPKL